MWARVDDPSGAFGQGASAVRGFLVPTSTRGFTATPIEGKLSMRASVQCDVALDRVRLPADAMLPGASGLSGPFGCLNEARYGIVWGAMGAARSCLEAALSRSIEREVFGRPIGANQLTQAKLADMFVEVEKGILLALHLGRLKERGALTPAQISVGKLNSVREALEIAHQARTILGGDGITERVPGDAACREPRVGAHLRGHRRDPPARARPRPHRAQRILMGEILVPSTTRDLRQSVVRSTCAPSLRRAFQPKENR